VDYLNGKIWDEITREERFFCAELFYELKNNIKPFLDKVKLNQEYEVGFEVCFYRDILKEYEIKNNGCFSQKRTFDLVLFSNEKIIIFEMKSHQKFRTKQLNDIKDDPCKIKCLFERINEEKKLKLDIPKVELWAIISSKYAPCLEEETKKIFKDNIIYWEELYTLYGNKSFKRANAIYQDRNKSNCK